MKNHEFEWGEFDTGLEMDPLCERCNFGLSDHPQEKTGITHEDETLGVDNSWKDAYTPLATDW